MKRIILLIILALSLCFTASCSDDKGDTSNPPNESQTLPGYNEADSKIILLAYSVAQEKGFDGSLDEFLALVKGADGKDGIDGKTPTVEISDDGYWVINGIKTEYKAVGENGTPGEPGEPGKTPTVEISDDGYWVINGIKSNVKASGSQGETGAGIKDVEFDEYGRLVITLTDGTVLEPVELPEKEEHVHNFGNWLVYGSCDDHILYAVCNECSRIEWRLGTENDHNWKNEYSYDASAHWIECEKCGKTSSQAVHIYAGDCDDSCKECNMTREPLSAHSYDNGCDAECNLCGKTRTPYGHKYDNACDTDCNECSKTRSTQCYDFNSDGICDICSAETNCECTDADSDEICDYCQAYVTSGEEILYPWETANLLMQLTENTNGQEIFSVSRKYLAGDINAGSDTVSDAARKRNTIAAEKNRVSLTYTYYPDTGDYAWGNNIERIEQTNKSGVDVPDIYTNFVYDMVGASLKGCFANLLANNLNANRGTNYFEFLKEEYDASRSDRGYMYEYMTSLTLAPDKKMYVLSSDYFIDMVRAFFCVPVSVKIMEDSGAAVVAQNAAGMTVYEGGDRNGDGEFTLDDFYKMVKDNEWTYDALAKFSASVWKPAASNDGTCILGDDVVGFAMASGGLAASGLLYTSSVEIIHKEQNSDGTYSYYYPSDNPDFYAFCDATTKLFGESSGIVYVKSGYTEYGDSSLLGIRKRFTENKVLFGDIMLVGGLEFSEYQEMKTAGGFGIVPVPLYRSGSDDKYLTQVHNVGVCGAISIVTAKFSECTAFLNYQSTHSEEILNNYYEYKLQYDLSNGSTGTIEMLEYIRANVRSSFDKAMEDALHVFKNDGSNAATGEDRWHNILAKYGFQIDIRSEYSSRYSAKEGLLDDLAAAFLNYPD